MSSASELTSVSEEKDVCFLGIEEACQWMKVVEIIFSINTKSNRFHELAKKVKRCFNFLVQCIFINGDQNLQLHDRQLELKCNAITWMWHFKLLACVFSDRQVFKVKGNSDFWLVEWALRPNSCDNVLCGLVDGFEGNADRDLSSPVLLWPVTGTVWVELLPADASWRNILSLRLLYHSSSTTFLLPTSWKTNNMKHWSSIEHQSITQVKQATETLHS